MPSNRRSSASLNGRERILLDSLWGSRRAANSRAAARIGRLDRGRRDLDNAQAFSFTGDPHPADPLVDVLAQADRGHQKALASADEHRAPVTDAEPIQARLPLQRLDVQARLSACQSELAERVGQLRQCCRDLWRRCAAERFRECMFGQQDDAHRGVARTCDGSEAGSNAPEERLLASQPRATPVWVVPKGRSRYCGRAQDLASARLTVTLRLSCPCIRRRPPIAFNNRWSRISISKPPMGGGHRCGDPR